MGQSMCRAALTICPNQPPSLLLFLTCRPAAAAAAPRYLPWDAGNKDGPSFASDVLVVDCTHGAAQTITNVGRVLKVIPMTNSGQASQAPNSALRALTCGIDNTMGELAIGYIPLTITQDVAGYIQALEY